MPPDAPEIACHAGGGDVTGVAPDNAGPATGSRHTPRRSTAARRARLRRGARRVDLARGVAATPADPWHAYGALPLAAGNRIAWSERARGLRVHRARRWRPRSTHASTSGPRAPDTEVGHA